MEAESPLENPFPVLHRERGMNNSTEADASGNTDTVWFFQLRCLVPVTCHRDSRLNFINDLLQQLEHRHELINLSVNTTNEEYQALRLESASTPPLPHTPTHTHTHTHTYHIFINKLNTHTRTHTGGFPCLLSTV